MFEVLFTMSLAGAAALAVWWVLCRLAGGRSSARWQYRTLKLALAFFLVPVGPLLKGCGAFLGTFAPVAPAPVAPVLPETAVPILPTAPVLPVMPQPLPDAPAAGLTLSAEIARLLVLAWVVGTVVLLVRKTAAYLRFRTHLRQAGLAEVPPQTAQLLRDCMEQLGVTAPVWVCLSSAVPTPFVMGLLRPVILLPDAPFSPAELRCILLHELTHIRCGDLWVRRVSLLALGLHWWNPAAHLLDRSLIDLSEESCDERVAAALSHRERVDYGQMLLRLACAPAAPEELAAPMSTIKTVQRRLSNMLHTKTMTKKQKVLAVCTALALLVCGTVTALAVKAPDVAEDVPSEAVSMEKLTNSVAFSDNVFSFTIPENKGDWSIHIAGRLEEGGGMSVHYLEDATWTAGETYSFQIDGGTYSELTMDIALNGEEATIDLTAYLDHGFGKTALGAWDLDHNGTPETVELAANYPEAAGATFWALNVLDADGNVLWSDTAATSHAGWNTLAACTVDGRDYLLRYHPTMYQGMGEYTYQIFSLGKNGNEVMLAEDTLSFDTNFGNPYHEPNFDPDAIADFLWTLRGYLANATVLLSTEDGALQSNVPGLTMLQNTPFGDLSTCRSQEELKTAVQQNVESNTPPDAAESAGTALPEKYRNAVRGDTGLILARGGTLLPDDDPSSYYESNGVFYKMFATKNSTPGNRYQFPEYAVGNQEILDKYQRQLLDTLVDGEYPKNSKGETYGGPMLAEYVGYNPDLVASVGTKGEEGYTRRADVYALPHDLPADQCPHEFTVPLYDSEGTVIGEFPVSCGGHFNGSSGMSIEEAKEAIAKDTGPALPVEYQNAVRGDTNLILARGGTLLPDDDPDSYYLIDGVAYKLFITRSSTSDMAYVQKECEVGNWDLLLDFEKKQANETLVNGDYPRNSKGETYGHSSLAHYVGYEPDLVRAKGTHGELGYTREADILALPSLPADQCPHEFTVPLYDSEGNIIGEFPVSCGGHFSGGMTIDEAKEALANDTMD